jgi:hypothetical protein
MLIMAASQEVSKRETKRGRVNRALPRRSATVPLLLLFGRLLSNPRKRADEAAMLEVITRNTAHALHVFSAFVGRTAQEVRAVPFIRQLLQLS